MSTDEARLLFSAAVSLDGFMAGPGGDMSWLAEHFEPDPTLEGLVGDVGALLVGARTFLGEDPGAGTANEGAFGGEWEGPAVVLTHHPPTEPPAGVRFLDDVVTAVHVAKEAAGGKPYVNVLGADVGRQCLEAGLLDEILMIVVPVMLGEGTRMFAHAGRVPLEPIHSSHTPRTTTMWFRVTR